jgi:hypothetical protein
MNDRWRFVVPTLAFLLMPRVGFAVPILDQVHDVSPLATWGGGFGCPCATPGDFFDVAQTFTVGVTGQLTSLDLYITSNPGFPSSPLLFDIRPVSSSGAPLAANTSALISRAIPAANIPGPDTAFFTVDLTSSNLSIVAGDVLAIVLRSELGNYGFGGAPYNPYGGGAFFGRQVLASPGWTLDGFNGDLGFRTFVEPASAVPEPSSLALLSCVVPLVLGLRRKLP